jgi:signal transduction histidine kinase
MLAEVAKRAPERGAPLDSIAALASEGSDEIRAFMRGLDPEASDWSSLEASLRERATRVVEQLGGAYEVSMTIAPDVPNPSPYLYVHLLRVFQEALTNALKHASSPTIDVALSATSERIVLEVRNDAVTQAQQGKKGINMGAGMANMKARAQDLGGSLAFSIDGEFATVVLSIPLPLRYAGERREDELRTPDPRRDRGG